MRYKIENNSLYNLFNFIYKQFYIDGISQNKNNKNYNKINLFFNDNTTIIVRCVLDFK